MPNPEGKNGNGHSPYAGRESEIVRAIADRLKTGEPLAQILRENCWPSHETLRKWRLTNPELDCIFACAREDGFDVIAAECLTIADDTSNDDIETEKGTIPNSEWIQRSRLRVETRLKLLAKWDPKRYGDKMDVTSGGDTIKAAAPQVIFVKPPVSGRRASFASRD